MKKAQLLTTVSAKPGYVAIVSDNLAPDSVGGKQKRYLVVETLNADGTKGMTNVFYMHDTATDDAWFYNTEPVAFDVKYEDATAVDLKGIRNYCKNTFFAYFFVEGRVDADNKRAVVEAYTLTDGKLVKSLVLVYKPAGNPVTHLAIV